MQPQMILLKLIAIALSAVFLFSSPVWASDTSKLFEIHCAGCHANGGNIVRRGKTLKLKALEKDGYTTVETITTLITNGKGNMSAYKDRLSETEIQDVAQYVLDRANQDWK